MTRNPIPSRALFFADLSGPSMQDEWRGNWVIALLFRRPGVWLAYWAAGRGLTPLALTTANLILALSLPVQAAALPLWLAPFSVTLCAAVFQIIDCADGTLARTTDQASKRGGDADFLVDMVQWGLLYAAIGLLADRTLDTGFMWTAFAAAAAWMRLMARVVRDRLKRGQPAATPPGPITPKDLPVVFISGLDGVMPFLPLLGTALPWGLGFLLAYALLDLIDAALPFLRS